MTEMKSGIMEAFSFRKGVVKVSGQWLRFGPEIVGTLRGLKVGDAVSYMVEDRTLKSIEKKQPEVVPAATPKPAMQPTAPKPTFTGLGMDNRNRSIERQVALKAAVELAGLYGYKSTKECLDAAASFAEWIEAGSTGAQPTPYPRS